MKIQKLVILTVLIILSCSPNSPVVGNIVIVVDPSLSTYDNKEAVLGVVENSYHLAGVRGGSKLTILSIGDRSTAFEPILIGQFYYPQNKKMMEGRSAETRLKQEFFLSVKEAVETGVSGSTETPLYLAILRGIETLRGQGCGGDQQPPHCHLWIISDGLETAEKSIARALNNPGKLNPPPELILNNASINVAFCNLSKRRDGKLIGTQNVQKVWNSLFAVPGAVSMLPFCPTTSEK